MGIHHVALLIALAASAHAQQQKGGKKSTPPPIVPSAGETAAVRAATQRLETALGSIRADPVLIADAEIYAKAGRWLLEFPDTYFTREGIGQALAVLDEGIARAVELEAGRSPWVARKGRKIYAFRSALDGSLQPYGVSVPESYDGSRSVPLYVWLHGRAPRLTEASFLATYPRPVNPKGTAYTADAGQIQTDVYGRWNNANHWAGEVDVFEAIEAVKKRYRIDEKRIVLRGFSMGGAGAWHIALHHPDRFAAAEVGAGTWPRRSTMPGFPPHQQAVLRICENINDWALNAFNIPIAGHDGDSDTQVASIPPPPPGTPARGQLESSIKIREQLAREGFPSEGDANDMSAKGTPSVFFISENTGHGVSPLVRDKLDAFLKRWTGRGVQSPNRVKFVTYTTRYDRAHWLSIDALDRHYNRAEVDAQRSGDGARYEVATKNVARLTLRETDRAAVVRIDDREMKVKAAPSIALEKRDGQWRVAGPSRGLRKTHALQGPIDDAFLDPFLLVRPTGHPWNDAANRQALRILARFDRLYARWYRAHPRVKNDTEVTEADFERYNVALFGDPGSNRWIGRLNSGKLPLRWTRQAIRLGTREYPAAGHLPLLIYPNPLAPRRYIVLNSGLTIDDSEYPRDYSMPRYGDFAILKVDPAVELPPAVEAGLFDESWRIP